MALVPNRPNNSEVVIAESTTSIATSPIAAYAVVPTAGYVQRCFAAAGGTTTGTITVAIAVNGGSDICNSALTIAAGSGARNNPVLELPLVGTAAGDTVFVNEGDFISFTPSGGTGSSIGGAFALVIRAAG